MAEKLPTSKYIGSRCPGSNLADFGPPGAEKLIFSDKTSGCSIDLTPKLIQFVILQGRSVSVLNAKLSTFVTVTGQNYENLKVLNRICSTDCNMEIILKFEFSGILPARRCPLRHREQPLHGDQEHCEQSGVGTLD